MDVGGVALGSAFQLQVDGVVQSGYGGVALSPMDGWVKREGVY